MIEQLLVLQYVFLYCFDIIQPLILFIIIMSFFHCECITQPIYSIARWMIKKGCNPDANMHQKVTSECEEDKLEDITAKHKKIQDLVSIQTPNPIAAKKQVIVPIKHKIQIPLPGIKAKVAEIQKSFEDQILLKSEEERSEMTKGKTEVTSDFTSFRVVKQHLGQYYQLFAAKTACFDEKFATKGTQLQAEQSPSNLVVSFMESENLNIFMYSFTLPCSTSFYRNMINDSEIQKQLDPNIEQCKVQEVISPNANIIYTAYKKVLIVSPRDFVSLKYSTDWKLDHWDVSISIPSPQVANRIRGEIVLNALRIRQTENPNEIEVKVYSEVNMKLSVRPKLTRNQSLTEIRKYVERCLKYIQENPEK